MSDYQRIVSYLYEYSRGIKGPNVGFAKIEKRQNQLRLYFHVKTNDQPLEYKIYFYRFHHGTMEGTLIDTVKRTDTIVEFKNTYPLTMDLNQIEGFLIYHSNDHFFGSEWNEHPITIRSFLPLDQASGQEQTDQPSASFPSESSEENKSPDDTQKKVLIPEEELSEESEEPSERSPEPEQREESKQSEAPQSSLAEYIEALQLEQDAKEQDQENVESSFDWKEYPSLPLPPSYGMSPCIKIQLEDLPLIPDLPDHLQTNGFLLLNYGNYGHLLLAWNKEKKHRYLGVPGIFDNEKIIYFQIVWFSGIYHSSPAASQNRKFWLFYSTRLTSCSAAQTVPKSMLLRGWLGTLPSVPVLPQPPLWRS